MVIAVIAVVVVVVGAVLAKVLWRPGGDELHSVDDYHSALGTIGDLASRNEPPGARRYRGPVSDPERPTIDPGERLVFDDNPSTAHPHGRATVGTAPRFRNDRARRHALSDMNHHPRRVVVTGAVVVVLVVFAALAYVGSHRGAKHDADHQSRHPGAATTAHSTPTTTPRHGTAPPSTTTTTTAPTQLVAASTSGSTAAYVAPAASYQLAVTASTGPVWIQATSTTSQTTLWAGMVEPGQSQQIPVTGASSLVLGASGSSVTANGIPVVLPSPMPIPFTATFTPAATAAPPTTTTTAPVGQ